MEIKSSLGKFIRGFYFYIYKIESNLGLRCIGFLREEAQYSVHMDCNNFLLIIVIALNYYNSYQLQQSTSR